MASGGSGRFVCDGCKRSYSWKPELAGKRVKCKCGHVMTVPQEPPKPEVEEDALYALADVEEKAAKSQTVTVVAAPIATAASSPSAGSRGAGKSTKASSAAGVPLGYRNAPTAREQARSSSSVHTDMNRDYYVPVGLFIAGMVISVAYYAIRYHLGATGISLMLAGLGIMTAFKAAVLIGFALVIAGPLGVSFGHPATAALKLAALAVFSDGISTWVDAGAAKLAGGTGVFEGMLSLPVALGVYWLLLIYLFSMDPGDSWIVVVLLAVFDFIARWLIALLLLNMVLGWGGAPAVSIPSFGGGSSMPAGADPLATRVTELKESKALEEARAFIADGHQAVFHDAVEAWYAAGCPNVWFSVDRDFNGKRDPNGVIVEMPKEKEKRAKVYEILKAYYEKVHIQYTPDQMKDKGDQYLEVEML